MNFNQKIFSSVIFFHNWMLAGTGNDYGFSA